MSEHGFRDFARRVWPEALAGMVFLALVVAQVQAVLARTGGEWVYPLDDTYIHMAIARNLAHHGVWGPTPFGFASASSSIVWTLLLAVIDAVSTSRVWAPLVANVVVGFALIAIAGSVVRRRAASMPSFVRAAVLLGTVAIVPMPTLAVIGMEHLAHAAVFIALLDEADRVLADRARSSVRLALVAALATGLRYESLFAVAVVGTALLLQRRGRALAIVVAAGLAPLIAFALYSYAHGGYPIPNSLLLKGTLARVVFGQGDFPPRSRLLSYDLHVADLLIAWLAPIAALFASARLARANSYACMMILAIAALHIAFAQVGWLLRYEAYLMGATCVFASIAFWNFVPSLRPVPRRALVAAGVMVLAVPAVRRAVVSQLITPTIAEDRANEHRPLARFVATYFDRDTIVINDLGMMAFYSHARLLDLFGLGSDEPLRLRVQPGGYTARKLDAWVRGAGARIAIVQRAWPEVARRIPASWTLVARLHLPRNTLFYTLDIGFYAIDPSQVSRLRADLAAFAPSLPRDDRLEFTATTSAP